MFSRVWPDSTHLTYTLEKVVVVVPWAAGRPGVACPGPACYWGAVSSLGPGLPFGGPLGLWVCVLLWCVATVCGLQGLSSLDRVTPSALRPFQLSTGAS